MRLVTSAHILYESFNSFEFVGGGVSDRRPFRADFPICSGIFPSGRRLCKAIFSRQLGCFSNLASTPGPWTNIFVKDLAHDPPLIHGNCICTPLQLNPQITKRRMTISSLPLIISSSRALKIPGKNPSFHNLAVRFSELVEIVPIFPRQYFLIVRRLVTTGVVKYELDAWPSLLGSCSTHPVQGVRQCYTSPTSCNFVQTSSRYSHD